MNQIITTCSNRDRDRHIIPEAAFLQLAKGLFGEHSSDLFAVHRKVVCFCGHEIASKDDMLTVNGTTETILEYYLNQLFCSTPNIECHCGRQGPIYATYSTGPILVIDIKNEASGFSGLKMTETVQIKPHPLFSQNYRLYGVLSRSGPQHVVADVRIKDKWFEIDDDRVQPKSGIGDVSAHPKMLIFEQIETSSVPDELRGIKNTRNTCFLSAVLVSLRHISDISVTINAGTTTEFIQNVKLVWNGKDEKVIYNAIEAIMSELNSNGNFVFGEQQCAGVFLGRLLEKIPFLKEYCKVSWKEKIVCTQNHFSETAPRSEKDYILNLCTSFKHEKVTEGVIFEDREYFINGTNNITPIDLPSESLSNPLITDIAIYLKHYFRYTIPKGSSCKQCLGSKYKYYFEFNFGRILVLQFNRFKTELDIRNRDPVCLSPELDLSDFNLPCKKYTLQAIVYHKGETLNNGHYTAVVKIGDEWVLFDNERVTRVQAIQDVSIDAYLLFYVENSP